MSERFERACETIAALGIHPRWRHAANSAALLRDKRVWYDFVRPGLLLYGIVPPPLSSTLALRPALSLHSRIVHVKGMRPGEGTGYGLKTVVDRPSATGADAPAIGGINQFRIRHVETGTGPIFQHLSHLVTRWTCGKC